ncbi:MAG: hypothetical protein ACLU3F_05165 [Blautia wexlerae]
MIMARLLPDDLKLTNGTLEGDIVPGDITILSSAEHMQMTNSVHILHRVKFFLLQQDHSVVSVYLQFHEMGRFYRHVLIEENYPHHGAVMFGHYGKALYEVFKYIGVDVEEIGYNQPAGVRYPTENPWG